MDFRRNRIQRISFRIHRVFFLSNITNGGERLKKSATGPIILVVVAAEKKLPF